jgi:hypothetical protein
LSKSPLSCEDLTLTHIDRREPAAVAVEEEKSDNIHDAIKIVLKKSLANDGKIHT